MQPRAPICVNSWSLHPARWTLPNPSNHYCLHTACWRHLFQIGRCIDSGTWFVPHLWCSLPKRGPCACCRFPTCSVKEVEEHHLVRKVSGTWSQLFGALGKSKWAFESSLQIPSGCLAAVGSGVQPCSPNSCHRSNFCQLACWNLSENAHSRFVEKVNISPF